MPIPTDIYPCLGTQVFGLCAYNPSNPGQIYFSIGDAIAALGFTLAIQQLFKPIYRFRMRARGLRVAHLLGGVFLGSACAVVAAVLPNIPTAHTTPFEYPIVWEIIGGMLIGIAYGVAALVAVRPARITRRNLRRYASAASTLLSSANDDDRESAAEDILTPRNVETLFTFASAWRQAEVHGSQVEMDRLRSIGAKQQIIGRPPISAFYLFTHRDALAAASTAATFLRILSDPGFCSVLVRRCPWLTAAALEHIAHRNIHVPQAEPFVRQVARQAILDDESLMAKEIAYTGFSSVPFLTESLFGNQFVLRHFDPLGNLDIGMFEKPSSDLVARLTAATEMMLKTALDEGDYWSSNYFSSAQRAYENLSRQIAYERYKAQPVNYLGQLFLGIDRFYKIAVRSLSDVDRGQKTGLFVTDPKTYQQGLIHSLACIVVDALEGISNEFKGIDDAAWSYAISIMMTIFPPIDRASLGMNPIQQQIAVQLIKKLKENMQGWYPAISRVLLATIGPHANQLDPTIRTAYAILKDAVYQELQKLPDLEKSKQKKFADFLPPNVAYDPIAETLEHTYRDGQSVVTKLKDLKLPNINLTDRTHWNLD